MAELHVQRKRQGLIWLWALIIIAIIAGLFFLYIHYKNPKVYPAANKSVGWVQTKNISYVTV